MISCLIAGHTERVGRRSFALDRLSSIDAQSPAARAALDGILGRTTPEDVLDREIGKIEGAVDEAEDAEALKERLKGLGYIS